MKSNSSEFSHWVSYKLLDSTAKPQADALAGKTKKNAADHEFQIELKGKSWKVTSIRPITGVENEPRQS